MQPFSYLGINYDNNNNILEYIVKQFWGLIKHDFLGFWATEMVFTLKWGNILQEMQCQCQV